MSCAQPKQRYYTQHVTFPEGTTAEQKIDMAAHVVPSDKQFAWQELELTAFIHFGINTFTDSEWGSGTEDPALFNPTALDCEQWVTTLKKGGFEMVILTAKHHDGFCLWPTETTEHSVVHSPWREGKGDVVRELSEACRKHDMKFGFYLSPWDRNAASYGDSPAYNKFFIAQLTELLTKYGKIGAIWFDGYWDQRHNAEKFDWGLDEQYAMIHRLQPDCLIGNNSHIAAHPGEDFQIFERDLPGENKAGYSDGQEVTNYLPLETCQTMNKSWGYVVKDTDYKSLEVLIRYLVSTSGKGANLLLNIGPQPNGELPAAALERLKGMGEWMRKYGDTIYGTTAGDIPAQDWGVTTRKGDRLFVHIFNLKEKTLTLNLKAKVTAAKAFDGGKAVAFSQSGESVTLTFDEVPSGTDYIVELTTEK